MSERAKEIPDQIRRSAPNEPLAGSEVVRVDCSGLARAIDMLAAGSLDGEPLVLLMRRELATLERRTQLVSQLHQRASIELRQLRDSGQREQMQRLDDQQQLQEQNDRFVSSLIQDHEQELQSVRRERDAAIDRVRELSRGMTRVGSGSSSSLQRSSISGTTKGVTTPPSEVAELRLRIDELLSERERSLRLLRQLAEQRDQAETRLQAISSGSKAHESSEPGPDVTGGAAQHSAEKADAALPALAHRQAASTNVKSTNVAGPTPTGRGADFGPSPALATKETLASAPSREGISQGGYSLHADQLVNDDAFAPQGAKSPRKAP